MDTKVETVEKQPIDYSPIEENNNQKTKCCFIITPIGDENSTIRRHIDGVIDSAIKPVVEEKGYKVRVAHREIGQGLITEDIINLVCDADIVIANLTGLNPNVMFEIALRYCTDKPIIHICEKGTNLPFDIKDQRTIFYTNDMFGVKEIKIELENMIGNINSDDKYKNIITSTRKNKVLIEAVANSGEITQFDVFMNELKSIKQLFNDKKYKEDSFRSFKEKYKYKFTLWLEYCGEDEFTSACRKILDIIAESSEFDDIQINTDMKIIIIEIIASRENIIKISRIYRALNFKDYIPNDGETISTYNYEY